MALTPTARKRRRLNYACNACRQRKIRCDEQQPSCHNCLVNGNPCVTTDKRRPGVSIQRHQAGRQSLSTTASQPNLSPSSTSGTRDLTDYQADVAVTTPAPATEEVHLTPDSHAEVRTDGSLVFSGRLPILIHSSGRTGVEILSDWLGLAFHRLNFRHRLDPSSVLSSVPSAPSVLDTVVTDFPPLPSRETARKLVDRFFTDVNSIFNLLDASEVLTDLDAVYAHGPDCVVRDRGLAPVLRLYLVFSTSSFSLLEIESLDFSRKCIGFCQTMLGHVIGWNDMEGIQIVFLLSLSLRSQDKVSLSWATIGLCVLMAVSLGLNRQKIPSEKGFSEVERAKEARKRRTWWCVYAFEKLHAFELGKGSSIVDADCSQPDPGCGDGEVPGSFSEPSTLVGLAKVLGLISRRCIQVRNREEKAITESAIAEKVRTTGESCLSLVKWAERLEEKYRPTSTMFTGSQASAFAVFLATSFNNALIMLTRNSMLISDTVHNATFEVLAKEQPWARFVGPRSAVATNAARHTVRFLTECAEFNSSIALPSIIVPLQAAYILIVQVVTHQASRTTASDLIVKPPLNPSVTPRWCIVLRTNFLWRSS
ncbi:hypothetical protein GQ53DRAFT_738639 [Thozetella sp. PMI_491]|nr:hypothetical protein GQ53DRAFT_738639 [Thozetella sp. PMI_491]